MQQPDLELVQVRRNESFKVWAHGYPYKTVRWHFHPEYELHLVTATTGTFRVGDYVGAFEPGNLVMTGPNLPHNWVSNVAPDEVIPERCLVLQFTQEFIQGCLALFPELDFVAGLLDESTHGIGFPPATAALVTPILTELLHAIGARRIALFVTLLNILGQIRTRVPLASGEFQSEPMKYMSGAMNHVLGHIRRNFTAELHESELAKLSGLSPSAFSRTFRKHTGMTFVPYINLLRIDFACQLLVQGRKNVTEICYETGFNNVSNFNRQFLLLKQTTPSKFRNTHTMNAAMAASAA
ncbi:AraC family transcriptional regulator [Lichenihabitans psoromatis]|uniref:AraC family transcriptional regulator n=1 Tax=Lichenihabitans psoromatis TaxID=2528642 RepID=UPI001035A253|nr:AraC family transcriptional regulator [Lichenihabitans psoromatis]